MVKLFSCIIIVFVIGCVTKTTITVPKSIQIDQIEAKEIAMKAWVDEMGVDSTAIMTSAKIQSDTIWEVIGFYDDSKDGWSINEKGDSTLQITLQGFFYAYINMKNGGIVKVYGGK